MFESLANNTASAALVYGQLLHDQCDEVVWQLVDGLHRRPAESGTSARVGASLAPVDFLASKDTIGAARWMIRMECLGVLSPGLFEIGRHPPARRLLMADCLQAPALREATAFEWPSPFLAIYVT